LTKEDLQKVKAVKKKMPKARKMGGKIDGGDELNESQQTLNRSVVSSVSRKKKDATPQEKMLSRQLDTVFNEAQLRNKHFAKFSNQNEYKSDVDSVATLNFLHLNPHIVKYAMDGIIHKKSAYNSPIVNQVRFFFLFKNIVFQMLLQTLPYNPQV
jgi:hypothetical protein